MRGTVPVEAICRLNLDGRAVKMSVVNAAARAIGSGLDHVPAKFFLDEAQRIVEGTQRLNDDASFQRIRESLDE